MARPLPGGRRMSPEPWAHEAEPGSKAGIPDRHWPMLDWGLSFPTWKPEGWAGRSHGPWALEAREGGGRPSLSPGQPVAPASPQTPLSSHVHPPPGHLPSCPWGLGLGTQDKLSRCLNDQ